jgi:hypothetical protein
VGGDRVGHWIMGGTALARPLVSFVGVNVTTPRQMRKRADAHVAAHRNPASWRSRWKPSWLHRWKAGGYKLNFDLRHTGCGKAGMIMEVAFTSYSIKLADFVTLGRGLPDALALTGAI